jgi:epoxyqueuosine reductase
MRSSISEPATLTARLRARAQALGFQAFGIAPAAGDPALAERLSAFIAAGHHGTMAWLEETLTRRASPKKPSRAALLPRPCGRKRSAPSSSP